ncbi:MAG: hypothetical protein IPO18_09445 [bacterium]|nr:hypothetical protein [bacterium]
MVMIRCIRARHCLGSVAIVALSTMFGVAAAMRAPDAMAQSTAASAGAGAKEYHTRFRNESGDGIRTVEIDGRIRFSADASRIEWMDDGAYLLVVTNDQGRNVRLRAEPDRNGQPSYRYEIDGRVKRSAADADHWLADTLPIAFRELGHDVEARVQVPTNRAAPTKSSGPSLPSDPTIPPASTMSPSSAARTCPTTTSSAPSRNWAPTSTRTRNWQRPSAALLPCTSTARHQDQLPGLPRPVRFRPREAPADP